MPKPILRTDVLDMKDLKEGMVLKGTVRNVIDFGAFVDIGVHQDGLVHISEMSEKFIKHPLEAVSVGDIVDVRVLGVDLKKKRISLSMKELINKEKHSVRRSGQECFALHYETKYNRIAIQMQQWFIPILYGTGEIGFTGKTAAVLLYYQMRIIEKIYIRINNEEMMRT